MTRRILPIPTRGRDSRNKHIRARTRGLQKPPIQSGVLSKRSISIGIILTLVSTLTVLTLIVYRVRAVRVWRGERVSVVVQRVAPQPHDSVVYVVSVLPPQRSLTVLSFPKELKIEAVGSFGQWRLDSIYQLGQIEGKGGRLLKESLEEFLGIEIDGWIIANSDFSFQEKDAKIRLRRMLLQVLFETDTTNLGVYDIGRLWLSTFSLERASTRMLDLGAAGVLQQQSEPDGSFSLVADEDLLDGLSREFFNHPEFLREDIAIAVLNATAHRGLATRVTRTIRNLGGNVVVVSDLPRQQQVSVLRLADRSLEASQTVRRLRVRFRIQSVEVGETRPYRAQVVFIVAEDWWKKISQL